jgi:arylsulfatase A-like enzyme
MPDQLRADCVGAFGSQVGATPNLDGLASRGAAFANAYAQHSVCGPSRASIFTGWYPHTAGHRTLDNLLKPWEPNALRLLKEAGYHVAWLGQRGDTFAPGVLGQSTDVSGFFVEPEFWHERGPFGPESRWFTRFYYGRRAGGVDGGPALDFDEAAVRSAEQFLADPPPEPWVLFVALFFPHPPFTVEEPWYSMHSRADMPRAAGLPVGGPRFVGRIAEMWQTGALSDDDWAELIATYYGMVSRVDDQFGRVLRALDRSGAADRTVTTFFTDHGEYLGDYGLVEKWPSGLHDCLLRNPLVMAGPGIEPGVRDTFVELVDLLPTWAEAGEAEVRHTHFGRSLWPVLRDSGLPHRDAAFSEGGFLAADEHLLERSPSTSPYFGKGELQHVEPESVGKAAAVRTERWCYVYRLYEGPELYDRAADPRELCNLAGRPEVAEVERSLRDRLLDWMVATSDVIPWTPDPRLHEGAQPVVRDRRP